tara:strand:+ start:114 stop:236 length:123 start_codon:yes stop_codon:yes gene_type:complete
MQVHNNKYKSRVRGIHSRYCKAERKADENKKRLQYRPNNL